ncbi:enoyl-CoA hydratase/isomerase family protein [Nocardioides insulae]|uniref:enoyl-CoA hydratase/isomerase family protein n=1 Tax=Nocardioides insulae TaxID=394734 RepID=UPI000687801B|nr:enoyl-CoA hydratase-related protein [Nocardioides insulae]
MNQVGTDQAGPVLLERRGAVAEVTLNRPDQHNALDVALKERLVDVLADLADDVSVRAVVLTGAGRSFCVGQDLGEHAHLLHSDPATAFGTVGAHYSPIVSALATMPKPVIAAVNGTCVGAGLGFALACDLRVFAEGGKLGTAFSGIGLTADSGLSATLVQAVGRARAAELLLLGPMFSTEDAVAWGVAGRIVSPDEVLGTARELADRLAAGPTLAYAESKALLAEAAAGADLESVLAAEGAAQARLGLTADHQGAVRSFLAKERPSFTGE